MIIYKAGSKYFSSLVKAETYRKKFFSSARYVERIVVDESDVPETSDIIARAHWCYEKGKDSIPKLESYWNVGWATDWGKTSTPMNLLEVTQSSAGYFHMSAYLITRDMDTAKKWASSKGILEKIKGITESLDPGTEEVVVKI